MTKDELQRTKERVNSAFEIILKLNEMSIERDAVIVDSLLETQLGKLRRLIVKKSTHDNLKQFADDLAEPFVPPDIMLSLKSEAIWR